MQLMVPASAVAVCMSGLREMASFRAACGQLTYCGWTSGRVIMPARTPWTRLHQNTLWSTPNMARKNAGGVGLKGTLKNPGGHMMTSWIEGLLIQPALYKSWPADHGSHQSPVLNDRI